MNKIKNWLLILAVAAGISVYSANSIMAYTSAPVATQQQQQTQGYMSVNPIDVVNRPNFYLNKNVKIRPETIRFLWQERKNLGWRTFVILYLKVV